MELGLGIFRGLCSTMSLMRSPHLPMMLTLGPVVVFRIFVTFVDGPITRRVSFLTLSFDNGLRRIALAFARRS